MPTQADVSSMISKGNFPPPPPSPTETPQQEKFQVKIPPKNIQVSEQTTGGQTQMIVEKPVEEASTAVKPTQ